MAEEFGEAYIPVDPARRGRSMSVWPLLRERVLESDQPDVVNHPSHYTSDPSGVECITITRHRNFNVGNAIKYLWRAGLKDDPGQSALEKQIEDLQKSVWYINDEIERLRALAGQG